MNKEKILKEPAIRICDTKTNEEVGRFYVENGELHFKGKAHKSAEIFIREMKSVFASYLESVIPEKKNIEGKNLVSDRRYWYARGKRDGHNECLSAIRQKAGLSEER